MTPEARLATIQRHIDHMPALPVTVTKVMEIANNPAASPVDLNKVISVDPVLMARVLKLINSAYYGLPNKIKSLARAIIMLGINTVKNLALSSAIVKTLGAGEHFDALNPQAFWRHSLGVGVTAKLLAAKRQVPPDAREEYFIAGLLHGIGKIPLNNALSDEYVNAMALADRSQIPLNDAERQVFGFDHADVGALIGKTWKLGESILDTISYYPRPTEYAGPYTDIVNTVHVAVYFVTIAEIGFSGDRHPAHVNEDALNALGVKVSSLDEIEEEVEAEIRKAEVFLSL